MTLSQWFSHKTAAFYTEQCTSPSLFHNLEVSSLTRLAQGGLASFLLRPGNEARAKGGSNRSLKNYGLISDAIFKNWRMCTNYLATKQLLSSLNYKICVHEDRESLWHPLLIQCLKRAWSRILQSILHTSTEEAYEDRLAALCMIDGELQLKHALPCTCLLKKVTQM